jgi:hypothetical protein
MCHALDEFLAARAAWPRGLDAIRTAVLAIAA